MATERISKGQYYRNLKDKVNDVWDRISFWTHADDVHLNNGVTLSTDLSEKDRKIGELLTNFAPIEGTNRVVRDYLIGQCLIYNNQFYKAIARIRIGDTLVIGTNITAVSVSELSSKLMANDGTEFYFGKYNEQYGFFPNSARLVDEFVPFSSGSLSETVLWENSSSYYESGVVFINENLDAYDYLKIYAKHTVDSGTYSILIPINDFKNSSNTYALLGYPSSSETYVRDYSIYGSGTNYVVDFRAAKLLSNYQTTSAYQEIPKKISAIG